MKNVDIIFIKYLDENMQITIGGIQTYITNLCNVIMGMGWRVRVVQFFDKDMEHFLENGVKVQGFCISGRDRYQALYDAAANSRAGDTLTIFATDTIIPKRISGKAIAIQHGIFWDRPKDKLCSLLRQVAARAYVAYNIIRRIERVDGVICVDYNFLNWYRTQVNKVSNLATIIPNYTKIAPRFDKPDDCIKIIFARRLFDYRGTRVFTEAIKRILNEEYPVEITIAGTGPDEEWMKKQLSGFERVRFIKYQSNESLAIHKDQHIAIVPTIGSEGTSLSLLEAMSAQCAVICSNVGGMTNIVIDNFNGLMVGSGEADALYKAIKQLLDDENLREFIRKNGYETVKAGFSYTNWQNKWVDFLKRVAHDDEEENRNYDLALLP